MSGETFHFELDSDQHAALKAMLDPHGVSVEDYLSEVLSETLAECAQLNAEGVKVTPADQKRIFTNILARAKAKLGLS